MQDPKNSHTRKRWYERAIEATTLWKSLSKPIDFPIKNNFSFSLWKKTISKTTQLNHNHDQIATNNSSRKLRKCKSTASSFSHVCLCAPISSSYVDILASPTPRRSLSYGRSRSVSSSTRQEIRAPISGRMSVEGRKIFRGKSLRDDVLMRRFVVEEEAIKKNIRGKMKRNEMDIIRRRSGMRFRRTNIGPSPLSRMVLAN